MPALPNSGNWTAAIATSEDGALTERLVRQNLGLSQFKNIFTGWRLEDCVLTRQSPLPDTFTCRRVEPFDGPALCPYGATIILRDHRGICRFMGTRIREAGHLNRGAESREYLFANALHRIQAKTFLQEWNAVINGVEVSDANSHLILAGTCAANITSILQFAIDNGVQIAIGTVDIPIKPPTIEIVAQKALQVLVDQLVWAPDAQIWFDYTTVDTIGKPTVHVRQAANFTAQTLNILDRGAGRKCVEVLGAIEQLDDEICPSVHIKYERVDTFNGIRRYSIFKDEYPVSSDPGDDHALNLVINLIGFEKTVVTAELLADQILSAANPGDVPAALAWWKTLCADLLNDRMANLTIVAGSFQRSLNKSPTSGVSTNDDDNSDTDPGLVPIEFANRLLPGSANIADWMRVDNDPDEDPIGWQRQWISVEFEADLYTTAAAALAATGDTTVTTGLVERKRKWRIPVQIIATDAPVGFSTYTSTRDAVEGEQPVAGLAQYLYDALHPTGYKGTVEVADVECENLAGPGQHLSLLGTNNAAHGTMEEPVQQVTEQIDTGRTTIQFAPAPALAHTRILEILRANRYLRRWTSTDTQADGTFVDESNVEMGQPNGHTNTNPGERLHAVFACWESDAKVLLDAQNRIISVTKVGVNSYFKAEVTDTTATVTASQNPFVLAQLYSAAFHAALQLTGTTIGGVVPSVTINTSAAHAAGFGADATDKGRPLSIVAIRDCDPADGSAVYNRLILASARYRVS